MQNITVVQLGWPLQSFTQNLIVSLSSAYNIFLIIDEFSLYSSRVDKEFLKSKNIQLYVVKTPFIPKFFRSSSLYHKVFNVILDRSVWFNKFLFSLANNIIITLQLHNFCFIAIEKQYLAFCHIFTHSQPLFYYSLELYYDDYSNKSVYRWIRKNEKLALKNLEHIIIQDRSRFDDFINRNKLPNANILKPLYVPVTISPSFFNIFFAL